MIALPFAANDEGTEMVDAQHQGKGKTDYRKPDEDIGVKIGGGQPADNPQGQEQNVYGTDAVHHGKD
jgi:hypothetical protein